MELTAKIDTSNLMRAQTILLRHSNTVPARAINSTAYFVIKDVIDGDGGFPVTSLDRIDTDMNVTTSPAILSNGRISTDKSRQRETVTFNNRSPTEDDPSAINTAMRIVLARMHPTSKFSLMTGNRWGIPVGAIPSFGRGSGRSGFDASAAFWGWVTQVAERMVKARHSSKGFLQRSWIDVRKALLPLTRVGKGKITPTATIETDYAEIRPAKEGGPLAVCVVSNTLGTGQKTTAPLSEKYNEANHRIATPRIQAAIAREFDDKMRYANAQAWAADEPELLALGLLVKA